MAKFCYIVIRTVLILWSDDMLRFNTYAKPCLRWLLAAITALAPTAAWADGSPPFVVTAAVVHALPPLSSRAAPGPAMGDFVLPPEEARATNLRNCADIGHGNGSVAPSDSNGGAWKAFLAFRQVGPRSPIFRGHSMTRGQSDFS
jgi:hypothetical protein